MGEALGKTGRQNKVAARIGMLLRPLHVLAEARGQLFAWVPVFLSCGIGLWFALPFEPGISHYSFVAVLALGLAALARFGPELVQPLLVPLVCICVGVLSAGARAHWVSAPMLDFRYYGAVQGRVIEIDRSQSDALRLLLDRVVLDNVAPDRTPGKVRISLHKSDFIANPGQVVLTTAFLSAPSGPAEPGGFDFRRMAYFDRLGAVGYTRSPVVIWEEPEPGTQLINRLRTYLAAQMMAAVPGQAGAFAAGAMTGDRSGIDLVTVQALRDSNLAHLLAISGMNMAFLTAFVFALVRYGAALIPPLALRVNSKKLAAVVAFGVAWFYLLLSGSNVATERAFLMVCVMLGAIFLDRRGLTLRSVALSAALLLLIEPESLGEPGFQLSFAATAVLIAGFAALDRRILREKMPRWMMPVFTLVLTSVLAGVATAPYAAATFNRFTDYGLLANLLTVPSMSILMGAGAVAALLAPIGLSAPALWVMEQASRWILYISEWVAGLDGAVTPIVQPGPWVIPIITLAGIWAIVWRGKIRWLAVAPMALGFGLWIAAERPQILISDDGNLVGLLGETGRALSVPRGGGFVAQNWLQSDGDLTAQIDAAARDGFSGPKEARDFSISGWRFRALRGKSAGQDLARACAEVDVVIVPTAVEPAADPPKHCLLIGRDVLDQAGTLAIAVTENAITLTPSRNAARIWMSQRPVLTERRFSKPLKQISAQ